MQNRACIFYAHDHIIKHVQQKAKTMKPKTKNPVGAPKILKDGRAHNVWLDSVTRIKAEKLGNGSVSAGIRIAVGSYEKAK